MNVMHCINLSFVNICGYSCISVDFNKICGYSHNKYPHIYEYRYRAKIYPTGREGKKYYPCLPVPLIFLVIISSNYILIIIVLHQLIY